MLRLIAYMGIMYFVGTTFTPAYSSTCFVSEELRTLFHTSCTNFSISATLCSSALSAFLEAFEDKDPNTVMEVDFQPYLEVLPFQALQPNTLLLWSGTGMLVEIVSMMSFSGSSVTSTKNIPTAAIIDSLNLCWCNTKSKSECSDNVSTTFWALISQKISMEATGIVFLLINGENPHGAYSTTTFFSKYELSNLEPPRVSKLVVLNVHRDSEGEACDTDSLSTLDRALDAQNLTHSCFDLRGNLNTPNDLKRIASCSLQVIEAHQQGIF